MLGILWKDRRTNESVHVAIKTRLGPQENLIGAVRRRKLAWFGHITRYKSLTKMVLQGTVYSCLLLLLLLSLTSVFYAAGTYHNRACHPPFRPACLVSSVLLFDVFMSSYRRSE